jgi:hypothetical protein
MPRITDFSIESLPNAVRAVVEPRLTKTDRLRRCRYCDTVWIESLDNTTTEIGTGDLEGQMIWFTNEWRRP